jgi:hypothetical protein
MPSRRPPSSRSSLTRIALEARIVGPSTPAPAVALPIFGGLLVLLLAALGRSPHALDAAAGLALEGVCPLGVAIAVATLVGRDRALELALATPTPYRSVLGLRAALVAWFAVERGPAVVPIGIAAFATVSLPGLAFVAAVSLTLPLLIGAPLYRVGFVGYWFWGNLLNESRLPIPTPAGTPFEAIGEYPSRAWFGGKVFEAFNRGIHPDTALALLSIAFLLLTAAAVLALAPTLLARRRLR